MIRKMFIVLSLFSLVSWAKVPLPKDEQTLLNYLNLVNKEVQLQMTSSTKPITQKEKAQFYKKFFVSTMRKMGYDFDVTVNKIMSKCLKIQNTPEKINEGFNCVFDTNEIALSPMLIPLIQDQDTGILNELTKDKIISKETKNKIDNFRKIYSLYLKNKIKKEEIEHDKWVREMLNREINSLDKGINKKLNEDLKYYSICEKNDYDENSSLDIDINTEIQSFLGNVNNFFSSSNPLVDYKSEKNDTWEESRSKWIKKNVLNYEEYMESKNKQNFKGTLLYKINTKNIKLKCTETKNHKYIEELINKSYNIYSVDEKGNLVDKDKKEN